MNEFNTDLSNLSTQVSEGRPGSVMLADVDMRIDREGVWYYHGTPIVRKNLVKLFSTVLRRDNEGRHWLVTPVEKCAVEVEDAPFLAVELMVESHGGPDQVISLRTNVDKFVTIDGDHPLRVEVDPKNGGPRPYVILDDGLKARVVRSVYYDLVELGVERKSGNDHMYGIWSSGAFFVLGALSTEEAS